MTIIWGVTSLAVVWACPHQFAIRKHLINRSVLVQDPLDLRPPGNQKSLHKDELNSTLQISEWIMVIAGFLSLHRYYPFFSLQGPVFWSGKMSYAGTRSTIVPELCFLLLGKGRVGCNFTWTLAPVGIMFWSTVKHRGMTPSHTHHDGYRQVSKGSA